LKGKKNHLHKISDTLDRTYNHIAFKIPELEYEIYRNRLEKAGVDFHEGRPRISGEGLSLFFHDYDNHLFELHTGDLEKRLQAYSIAKANSVSQQGAEADRP
jgi:hypothetical protein